MPKNLNEKALNELKELVESPIVPFPATINDNIAKLFRIAMAHGVYDTLSKHEIGEIVVAIEQIEKLNNTILKLFNNQRIS